MLWSQLSLQVRYKHMSCRKGYCISKSIHRGKWGPCSGMACLLFLFVSLRHTVRLWITWAKSNRKPGVIPSAPTELCSTGALTHKITSGGANHIPASVCFMTKGILLGIVTHTYWIALQVYENENKSLLQPHFQSGLTSTLFCPYHGFSLVKWE